MFRPSCVVTLYLWVSPAMQASPELVRFSMWPLFHPQYYLSWVKFCFLNLKNYKWTFLEPGASFKIEFDHYTEISRTWDGIVVAFLYVVWILRMLPLPTLNKSWSARTLLLERWVLPSQCDGLQLALASIWCNPFQEEQLNKPDF